MANISNTSWATSFFYEQDLKSSYMNGALNAGLRPGIYNGGISIYAEPTTGVAASGIFLHIKKGTTFVFSNSYTGVPFKRDFTSVGSYLIKSVALEDIDTCIVTTSNSLATQTRNYILGSNDINPPKQFYIAAMMVYHENQVGGYDVPKFVCAIDNPNYSPTASTLDDTTNWCFKTLNNDDTENPTYVIPEGGRTSSSNTKLVSYLMLGTVIDKLDVESLSLKPYSNWADTEVVNSWRKNHAFAAKGFEDYRQELTDTNRVRRAEVLVDPSFNKVYFDGPSISVRDNLYSKETDWHDVYSVKGYDHGRVSGVSIPAVDLSKYTTTTKLIITDFIYAPVKNHKSKVSYYDLNSLYDNNNSEIVNTLTLKDYQFISNYSDTMNLSVLNTSIKSDTTVLPSDLHTVTLVRLRKFIENKCILPVLADTLRKKEEIKPSTCDSILPIALIFRGVEIDASGAAPVIKFMDTISSTTTINPANILSLLNLSYAVSKIDTMQIVTGDAYSVLPIIG